MQSIRSVRTDHKDSKLIQKTYINRLNYYYDCDEKGLSNGNNNKITSIKIKQVLKHW